MSQVLEAELAEVTKTLGYEADGVSQLSTASEAIEAAEAPAAPENPLELTDDEIAKKSAVSDGKKRIQAQAQKARDAFNGWVKATAKLADEIAKLYAVMEEVNKTPPQRSDIMRELNLSISPARVSQLRETAEMFPKKMRDDSIDFKVYEVARETAYRSIIPLDPSDLATMVKALRDSDKVRGAVKAMDASFSIAVAPAMGRQLRTKIVADDGSAVVKLLAIAEINKSLGAFPRNAAELKGTLSLIADRVPIEHRLAMLKMVKQCAEKMPPPYQSKAEERDRELRERAAEMIVLDNTINIASL